MKNSSTAAVFLLICHFKRCYTVHQIKLWFCIKIQDCYETNSNIATAFVSQHACTAHAAMFGIYAWLALAS